MLTLSVNNHPEGALDISKYWKIIVDTLQDGVMVVDPGGTIIAVNPAAARDSAVTQKFADGRRVSRNNLQIYFGNVIVKLSANL